MEPPLTIASHLNNQVHASEVNPEAMTIYVALLSNFAFILPMRGFNK